MRSVLIEQTFEKCVHELSTADPCATLESNAVIMTTLPRVGLIPEQRDRYPDRD
jgi:hypothetical protein